MKIIDLLNKMANGEEVPHFKVGEIEYFLNWRGNLLEREEDKPSADVQWYIDKEWLNTKVEVIEEETKPLTKQDVEALGYACGEIRKCFINGWNKSLENKSFKEDKKIEKISLSTIEGKPMTLYTGTEVEIIEKINEIIDYLEDKNE